MQSRRVRGVVVVGLTGGIGAGKSTFAQLLAARGAEVIDVDAIGRAVIAPGTEGADAVKKRFGTTDRGELARVVFSDPGARRALEAISWPLIEDRLRELVAESRASVVVLDMAVLAQGLARGIYGPVVTVEAPDEVRLQRLVARGMGEDDARARMKAQASERDRRAVAQFVVVNDDGMAPLQAHADALMDALRKRPTAQA
jgi:dephospho-CoA kinase